MPQVKRHKWFRKREKSGNVSMRQRGGPFVTLRLRRATKTSHLLRLTRMGRPCGSFLKISKPSTCGFDFTIFRVVEGSRQNVVDSPISWQASQLGAQGS